MSDETVDPTESFTDATPADAVDSDDAFGDADSDDAFDSDDAEILGEDS